MTCEHFQLFLDVTLMLPHLTNNGHGAIVVLLLLVDLDWTLRFVCIAGQFCLSPSRGRYHGTMSQDGLDPCNPSASHLFLSFEDIHAFWVSAAQTLFNPPKY